MKDSAVKEQVILEVFAPSPKGGFPAIQKAMSQLSRLDGLLTIIGNKMLKLQTMKIGGGMAGSPFVKGQDPLSQALKTVQAQFDDANKVINNMIQANRTEARDAKVSGSQKVNLEVAGYDIHAFLAPGTKVKLQLTADDIVGGVSGGGGGGGGGGGKKGGGGGPEGPPAPIGSFSGGGQLIQKQTGAIDSETYALDKRHNVLKKISRVGDEIKEVTTDKVQKTAWDQIKESAAGYARELARSVAAAKRLGSVQAEAAARSKYARDIRGIAEDPAQKWESLTPLQKHQIYGRADAAEIRAATLTGGEAGRAAKLNEQRRAAIVKNRQKELDDEAAHRAKVRAEQQKVFDQARAESDRENAHIKKAESTRLATINKERAKQEAAEDARRAKVRAEQQKVFDQARAAAHQASIAGPDLRLSQQLGVAKGIDDPASRYQRMSGAMQNYANSIRALIASARSSGLTDKEVARLHSLVAAAEGSASGFSRQSRSEARRAAERARAEAERLRREAARRAAASAQNQLNADIAGVHSGAAGAYSSAVSGLGVMPADRVARAQAAVARHQSVVSGLSAIGGRFAPGTAQHTQVTQQLTQATVRLTAAQTALARANAAVAQSASHVGKNMVQNVIHVTQWAAAVGTLYGALRAIRSGAGSTVELEYQIARLGQVFRHGREQVNGLSNDVLRLAAANGRSSDEAMSSAIQWSRLGLNRVQVNEAVRVSLQAANVAEISAAEATDHLSSLMKVYGMNVRDLAGALGMMNAISNTYNVTNKDMLEGLTRTAAAAKQAGLSLAEVQGFIAAGVGATGQSGTNLGNALKSFIGAMSAPDKQKMMREMFQFETTNATGDLKDMSDILAQLFVHFQKLNEAQRQSFIFNVAGKHQASRITAILDNYIVSQTKAIEALLGMNSAERENAEILNTAKAQLQGLITEFERFALSIGKLGTLGVFRELTTGLRNVFSVLSGGNGVPGAMLIGVMTAIAAKSAVMMTAMGNAGRGGSFLRATLVGLVGALRDVSTALIQGISLWGRMPGRIGATATALSQVRRSTHGTAAAFRALSVGIGLAVAELAVVAGAIWLLASTWNRAMEIMGGSSDSANKGIDDFATSASRAAGEAEAAALQVKLFDTALKGLKNNPSQAQRFGIIDSIVEGLAPYRGSDLEDESRKQARDRERAGYREQLRDIETLSNARQRDAAYEKFFSEASKRASEERVRARVRERVANQAAIDAAMNEQRRLKSSMWGQMGWNRGTQSEIAGKLDELRKKRSQSFSDEADEQQASREAYRTRDQGHLTFLEAQKRLVQDISDIWAEMPGDTYTSNLEKQIGANEQILKTLEKQLQIDRERVEQLGGARATQLSTELSYAERMSAALRQQISGALSGGPTFRNAITGGNAGPYSRYGFDIFNEDEVRRHIASQTLGMGEESLPLQNSTRDLIEYLPKLEQLWDWERKVIEQRREAQTLSAGGGLDQARARAEDTQAAIDERRQELAAQINSRSMQEQRDRIKLAAQFGTWESNMFRVGDSDSGALSNQFAATRASAARHEALAQIVSLEGDNAEAIRQSVQAQAQLVQLQRIATEMNERQFELERKKEQAARDYNKALAMGGPGDILRRMAISRLTNNFRRNLTGGEFLAFDQGSKQIIDDRMRPGWEANENRQNLNRLGIGGNAQLEAFNQAIEKDLNRLRKLTGDTQQRQIDETARAAAALGTLADAAMRAAAALDRIGRPTAPSVPQLAQNPWPHAAGGHISGAEIVFPNGTAGPLD